MSMLEELISSLKGSPLDAQMKEICDKIMLEEKSKFQFTKFHPEGTNVFLIMELKSTAREMFFLTLEREASEKYVVRKYSRGHEKELKKPPLKIIESIPVKCDTPKKILTELAIKFKFEQGE